MNWVWENSNESGTNLLMLLAIADHANDDGVCWPSIARLAQRARVSDRQAKYIVKHLEESGSIEVQRGVGRNHTSVYVVKGAADCTISEIEKVQPIAPIKKIKGAIQRKKVQSSVEKVQPIAPDPLEPPIEPIKENTSLPAEPKAPTPQQEYFGAVCACVGWDYRTITKEQTGQVAQTVGVLQDAKYTIDDLREFWRWWRKNDWRGQKGQYPTLQQLRSEIGKIRVQAEPFVPPATNGGGSTRYGVKDLSHG